MYIAHADALKQLLNTSFCHFWLHVPEFALCHPVWKMNSSLITSFHLKGSVLLSVVQFTLWQVVQLHTICLLSDFWQLRRSTASVNLELYQQAGRLLREMYAFACLSHSIYNLSFLCEITWFSLAAFTPALFRAKR